MRCWIVVILIALQSALSSASPTTATALRLREQDFRYAALQWDEHSARHFPAPALTSWSGEGFELVGYEAGLALAGRLPPGWREVVGAVGGPVPGGSELRFISGEIDGARITVRAAYEHGAGLKSIRLKDYLFVGITLPENLADGEYDFELFIENVPDDVAQRAHEAIATKPATQPIYPGVAAKLSARIVKPHPYQKQRREFFERLKTLTDEQLIAEYYRTGELIRNQAVGPRDEHPSGNAMFQYMHPLYAQFQTVRAEMARRMPDLRPTLIALLRKEWSRNAGAESGTFPFGFARDLMTLLSEDRDLSTAEVLIDMLDAPVGTIFDPLRRHALDLLERLTYLSLRPVNPNNGNYAYAVPDPAQEPIILNASRDSAEQLKMYSSLAQRYRQWLKDAGRAPTAWLPLAQARARHYLYSNDLDSVYCAAAFLSAPAGYTFEKWFPRDDKPADTLERLSEILARVRLVEWNDSGYPSLVVDGKQLPVSLGNWTHFVWRYGTQARPYVDLLIRTQELLAPKWPWRSVTHLADIGGPKVIESFIEWQPVIERQIADQKLDELMKRRDVHLTNEQSWLLTYRRTVLWGVQRWTGHAFRDWDEVRPWWNENKDKSEDRWMREGLFFTAERADAGQADAQALLRTLIPELPKDPDELPFTRPPFIPPSRTPAARPFRVFRTEWLRQNSHRLTYNARTATFEIVD